MNAFKFKLYQFLLVLSFHTCDLLCFKRVNQLFLKHNVYAKLNSIFKLVILKLMQYVFKIDIKIKKKYVDLISQNVFLEKNSKFCLIREIQNF